MSYYDDYEGGCDYYGGANPYYVPLKERKYRLTQCLKYEKDPDTGKKVCVDRNDKPQEFINDVLAQVNNTKLDRSNLRNKTRAEYFKSGETGVILGVKNSISGLKKQLSAIEMNLFNLMMLNGQRRPEEKRQYQIKDTRVRKTGKAYARISDKNALLPEDAVKFMDKRTRAYKLAQGMKLKDLKPRKVRQNVVFYE
jgi:hypothetical protein